MLGRAHIPRESAILVQEIEQFLSITMALRPYPNDRSKAVYYIKLRLKPCLAFSVALGDPISLRMVRGADAAIVSVFIGCPFFQKHFFGLKVDNDTITPF